MEQSKRQRTNNIHDSNDNKRKKLLDKTFNTNKIHFEDLSNDLMYEMFDYLDIYHIYQSFFNLNKRFKNLLINSTLPIHINISSMSKSNFHRYYSHIIRPNKHRITLLRLTNPFILDLIFSPIRLISKFTRLETLILNNIQSKYLDNILDYAHLYLPKLSSLILHPIDEIQCPSVIYYQIFSLPFLKYCKIKFETKSNFGLLSSCDDKEFSSIEHLIINNRIWLDEIDYFLSYFPHLQRLSINYLDGSRSKRSKISSIKLKYLTHISFKLQCLNFNQFQQLIIDYFHQVEVLNISTRYDVAYLDANRWEEFILNHIPYLKIFDINHIGSERSYNNNNQIIYHHLIDKFASPFWIERQWFFTHQHDWRRASDSGVFYSTNPYKRKSYTLYWEMDENCCSFHQETNLDIVNHVYISNAQAMINCINYFLNVRELTFDSKFDTPDSSMVTTLNRILPLSQLTKLVIECYKFPFQRLIELLSSALNIHTIQFRIIPIEDAEYELIQECESFRLISNTNMIKHIVIDECCTLKKLQLFVDLFPRLEQLTTGMDRKEFLSIIRFLLAKNNKNTDHLFFLCVLNAPKISLKELKRLIKIDKLLDDYSIDHFNRKLYLWW